MDLQPVRVVDADLHPSQRETAAVRALAAGMDLPAEVLLGLSDVNHWTAWQVDESAYRQHVDPIVQTLGKLERRLAILRHPAL